MITIRKATIEDADEISYLIQQNTLSNPNDYNEAQIKAWVAYNTSCNIRKQFKEREIYCAFNKNILIGTIGLQENEVVGFYMSPSQRGKGIGKKLFDFIENIIIQKKYTIITLTATPSAVKFYEKRGFSILKTIVVTIDSVDYQEYRMRKVIKN